MPTPVSSSAVPPRPAATQHLPVALMAVAGGVVAAELYYLQPLFAAVARDLGRAPADVGTAFTASQLGFATGLLAIVPLVDLVERRRLVLALVTVGAGLVALMGLTTSLPLLRLAAFAVGLTAVVPQTLVALAASVAAPGERSRTMGRITGGILVGILLSRTISGTIAAAAGWRAVFWIGSAVALVLAVALARALPASPAPHALTYRDTLASMRRLFAEQPTLRNAALVGGLTFAAFSALWTGLALHLADAPFHYGPGTIGLYGLAGAAGAVIANVAGRLLDVVEPTRILVGALLIAWVSMLLGLLMGNSAIALAIVIIGFDIGVQAAHLSNQTRIFRLDAAAIGRLNGLYMVCYFTGGAVGSLGATRLYARWGWPAVAAGALALTSGALLTAWRASKAAAAEPTPQRDEPSRLRSVSAASRSLAARADMPRAS